MGVTVAFLLLLPLATGTYPGGVGRITSKGISFALSEVSEQLTSKIAQINIPDIHVDHLDATGIRLSNVGKLAFSYVLHPPTSLTLTGSEPYVELHGHFHAYKRILGIKVSKSGSFVAKASHTSLTVETKAGVDSTQHPTLTLLSCSANVPSLEIKLDAGFIGWVVDLFHHSLEGKLRPVLQNALCTVIKDHFAGDLKKLLATLPLLVKLNGPFMLDYRLTSAPVVTSAYIQGGVSGEISYQGHGGTPFARPMPVEGTGTDKMLYLFVTDWLLNSGLYWENKYRYLHYQISNTTEPSIAKYLKTTCDILNPCIGTLFPDLANNYPNTTAILDITVPEDNPPLVTFDSKGATVTGGADIPIKVYNSSGKPTAVLKTMNFTAKALLEPAMLGNKVVGKVYIKSLTIPGVLPFFVDVLKGVLTVEVNSYLRKGIPLPVVDDYVLVNSQILFANRTIQIGSDVARKSTLF